MHATPLPEDYRSGFIALIGRPNVGKSTLVNQLVGEKVAITSPVAQTTRNRLRAILTTEVAQMVLVDTPGIHKPHHLLGERLVKRPAAPSVKWTWWCCSWRAASARGAVMPSS